MVAKSHIQQVAQVDEFLRADKYLDGPPPPWEKSEAWGGEYVAIWNMLDEYRAPVGYLQCFAKVADTSVCGLNLIFRSHPIWRVHIDAPGVCHGNLHDAHRLGLPDRVCGPHEHAWPINREHILNQDVWDLPYRRASAAKRISAALALLADNVGLTLTPEQRSFDGPTKGDLFDMMRT